MPSHRSIGTLVEEQARRSWLFRSVEEPARKRRPVITVSRQYGARGGEVARRVAEELGFDLYDREIIHRIAEDAHETDRVVAAFDEKDRELLTDWMTAFANEHALGLVGYRHHLTRVVSALAERGGAVILGRGAHIVLGQGNALRVWVSAPLDNRIRTVADREGLSERDARQRVAEVDAERRAFLARLFRVEAADPTQFDLVLNTGVLGVGGAVLAVRAALPALPVKTTGSFAAR
jgi:cytidylate kinase